MLHRLFSLALCVIFVLLTSPAHAHDETVSTSDVVLESNCVRWSVDVGLDGLRKAVAIPDGEISEEALETTELAISSYLLRGVDVVADGRAISGRAVGLRPIYEPSLVTGRPRIARVVLQMMFVPETPARTVSARVHFFEDLTSRHRAVVRVTDHGASREYVRLGPAQLDLTPAASPPSVWSVVSDFVRWGVFHIFTGYDHIAFLVGLLLATTRVRELVKIITSFTLAHSATILLSALDVVHLPVRITEALIAASIVYIAAENLGRREDKLRHRWLLAFGFGLVHGLGFAAELRARLMALPGRILLPILSFNVGVELGQLVVVALILPLLYLLRSHAKVMGGLSEQRVLRLGSIPILGLGLFWLVERAVL